METILRPFRNMFRYMLRGAPIKPGPEVQKLLMHLQMMPRHLNVLYSCFSLLKQDEKDEKTITTASEVTSTSLIKMVHHRKKWVEPCLKRLVEFGGCYDTVSWDNFLYIFLTFNSLSKVELCQTMFYIIMKEVKSWTIHYLTSSQLQEYYEAYRECPVDSFNTKEIAFARLPLHRYYIPDFVELCHRYSELINPLIHLQRSLQSVLPSMSFWNDYDRVECFNRRINLEFFKIKKNNMFLRGDPAFQEKASMLIPDMLGGERVNLDQWQRRMKHYDHRQGVWPDFKRKGKAGQVAPEQGDTALMNAMMVQHNHSQQYLGPQGMMPAGMHPNLQGQQHGMMPGAGGAGGMPGGMHHPGAIHDPNATGEHDDKNGHAVTDIIRMGVQPVNWGINNENVPQHKKAITSASVKKTIGETLNEGGQYTDRVAQNIGKITDLPSWMHPYVTIPVVKRTMQDRFTETEFVQSMRQGRAAQKSVVELLEKANEVPLVPRPGKQFKLDTRKKEDEDWV